jgi:hypothetical protein
LVSQTDPESGLDVLDVGDLAAAVEGDADRVEANLSVAGQGGTPLRQPGGGEAAHLTLLARTDRVDRPHGAEARVLATGLHLEEDQGRALERDDVELAVAGTCVALDDLPAGGQEARDGDLLRGAAGASASFGHGERG